MEAVDERKARRGVVERWRQQSRQWRNQQSSWALAPVRFKTRTLWSSLEGSGGVKREDLPSWKAVSGVDVVSSSEVNMNSGTFDFSMLIGGV